MNGNWAQLEMTRRLGASATLASFALTTFWAMVTAGRVLFARIEQWLPTRVTYRVLPFVLAVAPGRHRVASGRHPGPGDPRVRAGRPGLLGAAAAHHQLRQEQLVVMSASVAGGVIAFYQLGYGIAAFGAGPLQDAGVGLPAIFGFTAVTAVVMGGLSFMVAAREPTRTSTRA